MKVLVTGGAGFIGEAVTHLLLESGHEVTVFDDLSLGHRDAVPPTVRFIKGDITNPGAIHHAVAGQHAVVHLAAQAIVPDSVANPQKAFHINLTGGQNLLEAMRTQRVEKLIYASSAAVYGHPVRTPIKESDATVPLTPYGATKLAFEHLAEAYHASYGLNVVMFRFFNPYGPNERHHPETHAIPNFINASLTGKPVPLYWNGRQMRDFFYVDDIARAHVMALHSTGLHTYNLGSGEAKSVKDVLNLVSKMAGRNTGIEDLGERKGDSPTLLADISKARTQLRWRPQTTLENGLELTIQAFRQRLR